MTTPSRNTRPGVDSTAALDPTSTPPLGGIVGPVQDEVHMPGDCDMLIQTAQEGVLSVETAKRWCYILEIAYQEYQSRLGQEAEWRVAGRFCTKARQWRST